jgi:CHAT domain-containing protein
MGIQSNYIQSNSYLKSGILLSGSQNTFNGDVSTALDNGVFTALEAKSLDLKETELVVLSACETGLGDDLIGEGVYGLQRAFMIAGAKSVVMSLWKVDDDVTNQLMQLFYKNWIGKGMKKNMAFREAKLELKKEHPEPYFWAPFILIE